MHSKAELEQMVESAGTWWHSIDLGQGVVTPGKKSARFLAKELHSLQLPDLTGKSVLDIGAFSGFYSFEAERRGAARVVALDHYVWSIDMPRFRQILRAVHGAQYRTAHGGANSSLAAGPLTGQAPL